MESEPYAVEVRWSPAHELLMSLVTYLNYPEQKLLDLGTAWRREVRRRLPAHLPGLLDDLFVGKGPLRKAADSRAAAQGGAVRSLIYLLAWASPADLSAGEFIAWAGGIPVLSLLELVSEAFGTTADVPANLAALRERGVELLSGWYDAYFSSVDSAIMDGLRKDSEAKAALIGGVSAQRLVEHASCGVVLEPTPGMHTVVLIPQYHSRPWNIFVDLGGRLVLYYPAEAWAAEPGQPPTRLLRLTRALGDESRLRLLAFLAGGTRTFGAIADHLGLAKSTIHYHMVVLRAAGLVRVFTRYGQYLGDRYALRREALGELGAELVRFVDAEESR